MNTKLSAPTVLMRESDKVGLISAMSLWEGVFATGVGGKRGWLSILTLPQDTEWCCQTNANQSLLGQ